MDFLKEILHPNILHLVGGYVSDTARIILGYGDHMKYATMLTYMRNLLEANNIQGCLAIASNIEYYLGLDTFKLSKRIDYVTLVRVGIKLFEQPPYDIMFAGGGYCGGMARMISNMHESCDLYAEDQLCYIIMTMDIMTSANYVESNELVAGINQDSSVAGEILAVTKRDNLIRDIIDLNRNVDVYAILLEVLVILDKNDETSVRSQVTKYNDSHVLSMIANLDSLNLDFLTICLRYCYYLDLLSFMDLIKLNIHKISKDDLKLFSVYCLQYLMNEEYNHDSLYKLTIERTIRRQAQKNNNTFELARMLYNFVIDPSEDES